MIDVDQAPSDAEDLPWELLCDIAENPPRFFAVDQYATVTRQVASRDVDALRVDGALRICALLSAVGVKAATEWAALETSIRALPVGHPPVELSVFVGEANLHAAITAAALPQCKRVEFLPTKLDDLMKIVRGISPHVLHLFCHGRVEPFAHLDLATQLDHDVGAMSGSLVIDDAAIDAIVCDAGDASGWLLVLSACKGAAGSGGNASLANLAVRKGFLGAIGMREPVDVLDTAAFAGAFYSRLFAQLPTAGAKKRVDVALAVARGRRAIAMRYAGLGMPLGRVPLTTKPWSFPTLYAARGRDVELTYEPPAKKIEPVVLECIS